MLAEGLYNGEKKYAGAWNFGPADEDARSVRWIAERIAEIRPDLRWECSTEDQPHEAQYLKLDSSKARARLGWQPRWDLGTALAKTMEWHHAWQQHADMRAFTLSQIAEYQQKLLREPRLQ